MKKIDLGLVKRQMMRDVRSNIFQFFHVRRYMLKSMLDPGITGLIGREACITIDKHPHS